MAAMPKCQARHNTHLVGIPDLTWTLLLLLWRLTLRLKLWWQYCRISGVFRNSRKLQGWTAEASVLKDRTKQADFVGRTLQLKNVAYDDVHA